ncbi:MAG: hypothetical protein AB1657_01800 [Candidatus Micrarchaeota archaeon]
MVEREMRREHVSSLDELRTQGYQAIGMRMEDGRNLLFATRDQNLDLGGANVDNVIRSHVGSFRVFEMDERAHNVRELNQNEIRQAMGMPTGFRYEQQQEALQNYRNDIQSVLNTGDVARAVEVGFEQQRYAEQSIAGQMAGVFREIFGFGVEDFTGWTNQFDPESRRQDVVAFIQRPEIVAALKAKGIETRVARAPEVREEPRVAEAGPSARDREVDQAMFDSGLSRYLSTAPGVMTDPELREFGLSQAVEYYDRIKGYDIKQAMYLESVFETRTGLDINSDDVRSRVDAYRSRHPSV